MELADVCFECYPSTLAKQVGMNASGRQSQIAQNDETCDWNPTGIRMDLVVFIFWQHIVSLIVPENDEKSSPCYHRLCSNSDEYTPRVNPSQKRFKLRKHVCTPHTINPNVSIKTGSKEPFVHWIDIRSLRIGIL